MDLSLRDIQRIKYWIQSEVNNNILNTFYSIWLEIVKFNFRKIT